MAEYRTHEIGRLLLLDCRHDVEAKTDETPVVAYCPKCGCDRFVDGEWRRA